MKKGKTGFFTWLITGALWLSGLFMLACEFLPLYIPKGGALVSKLVSIRMKLAPYLSMSGEFHGRVLLPAAVFALAMGMLLIIYRRRKPYSILFWCYLWWVMASFMVFFRARAGVHGLYGVTELLTPDKMPLMIVLLVLEILLGLILMYVCGTLDQKWRASGGAKDSGKSSKKGSKKKDKAPSMREVKKEEKRRIREQQAREKIKAEEDEKKRKAEEAEEEKRKAEEEREERIAQARLKKAEEKEERKEAKRREKEERRLSRKNRKEDEEDDEESFSTPAPQGSIPEPARSMDEKLSFPEIADIPRLQTIEHSEDLDKVAPDPQQEFRKSFGLMNSIKEEADREELAARESAVPMEEEDEDNFRVERRGTKPSFDDGRDRYTSGSMVEATLESIKEVNTDIDRKSLHLNPIIGLDDDRTQRQADQQAPRSSIAPSTLSKNHPRYKMFESLAHAPQEDNSQFGIPTTTTGAPNSLPQEDEHFAPSNLSKDHPRYKLFESLRRDNPSSTNVSHMPGMPFRAEETPVVQPASYESTFVRERDQQESLADKMSRERMESISSDNPYLNQGRQQIPQYRQPTAPAEQYYQQPAAPAQQYQQPVAPAQQYQQPVAPAQPYQQPVAPAQQYQQPAAPVETYQQQAPAVHPAAVDPMASWQPPAMEQSQPEPAPVRKGPMRAEDIESIDEKHKGKYDDTPAPTKEQENEFYYSIGISGLSSQDSGMFGVRQREMMSYTPPTKDILVDYPSADREIDYLTRERGEAITSCFEKFKIHVTLDNIIKGPTVTMYEIKLGEGIPVSKVKNHNEDIMYALGIRSVRILAPVPGKQAIGIEVPNTRRATIGFKDMLYAFENDESSKKMAVPFILGRTVTGEPVSIDVAKTPHLLIAGSTGSGKSVGINSLIATILYNKSPRDVRLIMVDPKVVELKIYNGIPHLLTPVITEAKKVKAVLSWLTEEMDRRYEMLSRYNVRNIVAFNEKLKQNKIVAERLPYIVLIMDEYADLMTTIGKDIEYYVGRLTAMARAVGIHLVLATQRPDADVVTGIIKANIPSRIAFAVGSGINSRIILDEQGAEQLLGKGDLLYKTPSSLETTRIQGAFLSDGEVEDIVDQVKKNGEPDYLDESIFEDPEEAAAEEEDEWDVGIDPDEDEYEQAKSIVYERKCASASYLQRRMKIGYNKAARFVERMEEEGIIGPPNGSKPRELIKML